MSFFNTHALQHCSIARACNINLYTMVMKKRSMEKKNCPGSKRIILPGQKWHNGTNLC